MNNNNSVSIEANAAHQMAGQNVFSLYACSRANHCLQAASQRSVELLTFNFACRTFAYRRLASNVSKFLSIQSKCHVRTKKVDCSGRILKLKDVTTAQKQKVMKCLEKIELPRINENTTKRHCLSHLLHKSHTLVRKMAKTFFPTPQNNTK